MMEDVALGLKHGVDTSNWFFQVWFFGIPVAYFTLVFLFRALNLWEFKTRKGGRSSDIMAFELCALVSVTYLGIAGVIGQYDLFGVEESVALSTNMFYAKSSFVENHLIYPMVTFQGWNVLLCFFSPDLRDPAMIGHHLVTATLGYLGFHPYLHGAGLFFFGIAELSNVPLTIYDIFKYFKAANFQTKYPMLYQLSQVSFALSFIVLRLIIWPIKSWTFWMGSIDLLQKGTAHSNFAVGFFLLANVFLTLLQFLWGWQIIKFLLPAGKSSGDKDNKKKR
jgi:hypothetical protein